MTEWESRGTLTIADALAKAVIAYGSTAFVCIRLRAEEVPPPARRETALRELAELPPEPQFVTAADEFPPETPFGEVERIRGERYVAWKEWRERHYELTMLAHPFDYIVGSGDNISSERWRREYVGHTWEEALAAAHIAGATERLPWWMR